MITNLRKKFRHSNSFLSPFSFLSSLKYFTFLVCVTFLPFIILNGCAPQPVMSPIQYEKPIEFQIKKKAILQWDYGKQYDGTIPNQDHNIIPNQVHNSALGAVISSMDRANNPSRYTLSYGKAEQAIFMTSLKDTLEQKQAFKEVELVSDAKSLTPNDTLIDVFFKKTRVATPEKGYKITLSVMMTIISPGKPHFKRTYLLESDPQTSKSFVDQQQQVSTKLLEKLITGMEEWHSS